MTSSSTRAPRPRWNTDSPSITAAIAAGSTAAAVAAYLVGASGTTAVIAGAILYVALVILAEVVHAGEAG